ncbi:MAG: thiamine diphosphokinase [Chloroflexota bacterium]|nr:MAG: thiamine diphosphokinase [Chloroflexota bacterium]
MRAVIFANGIFNPSSTFSVELSDHDLIIAADGGAHHCLELGIIPDFLIGDMDSVQPELIKDFQSEGTQLVVYPRDKDQIDLELALSLALEKDAKEVLLFGLLGGRLDLSLANLLLLARDDWEKMSLKVIDGLDTAYMMRHHGHVSLSGNPGDVVSLIPLTDQVLNITTRGLRWPLLNANLEIGSTLSISNELSQNSAEIDIGNGKLLLVHRATPEVEGKE